MHSFSSGDVFDQHKRAVIVDITGGQRVKIRTERAITSWRLLYALIS